MNFHWYIYKVSLGPKAVKLVRVLNVLFEPKNFNLNFIEIARFKEYIPYTDQFYILGP